MSNSTKFEKDVRAVMQELGDLLIQKHYDYGPKNIAESPGGPINGLRVRMWDKLARINNLFDKKREAVNEPFGIYTQASISELCDIVID